MSSDYSTIPAILDMELRDEDVHVWTVQLGEQSLTIVRLGRAPALCRLVAPGRASETAGFISPLDVMAWFGLLNERLTDHVRLGEAIEWRRDPSQERVMIENRNREKTRAQLGGAGPLAFPGRRGGD